MPQRRRPIAPPPGRGRPSAPPPRRGRPSAPSPGRGRPLGRPFTMLVSMPRPDSSSRKLVVRDRLRLYLDAVPRSKRRHVPRIPGDAGIDEMLVQVVDVLADAMLERTAHRHVVEDRQVLDVLAE